MKEYGTEIVAVGTPISNILSKLNHDRQDSLVYADKVCAKTQDRLHAFLPVAFLLPSVAIGLMSAENAYSHLIGYF